MLGWGFGDFFIQKATRKIDDWEPLFLITFFGAIILLPFVYDKIPAALSSTKDVLILFGASAVLFFAALLDFEALKKGKLSVVEPIWSWEIPVGAFLAYMVFGEKITLSQLLLIVSLVTGLFMVSLKSLNILKKIWVERAVYLALASATTMGAANFLIGWGARVTDPLTINWFVNISVALLCLIYIAFTRPLSDITKNIRKHPWIIAGMCIFDNSAWIAFAYAMVLIPIAIAVSLSESYIIVVVLLGLFVNKENIKVHQKVGLIIAILSAIALAAIS